MEVFRAWGLGAARMGSRQEIYEVMCGGYPEGLRMGGRPRDAEACLQEPGHPDGRLAQRLRVLLPVLPLPVPLPRGCPRPGEGGVHPVNSTLEPRQVLAVWAGARDGCTLAPGRVQPEGPPLPAWPVFTFSEAPSRALYSDSPC